MRKIINKVSDNNKTIAWALLAVALGVGLSACAQQQADSLRHNADVSYARSADAVATVAVPASLKPMVQQDVYRVKALPARPIAKPSLLPPDSQLARDASGLVTQKGDWLVNGKLDRVWRHVGQALERSDYEILEQDKSMGLFYVWSRPQANAGASKDNQPDVVQIKVAKQPNERVLIALRDENGQVLSEKKARTIKSMLQGV